jgi:hypothetical protein
MTAAVTVAAVAAVSATSGMTAAGAATGEAKQVDLYVLTAQGGRLDAIPQHRHTFALVLHRPRAEVALRRDQPERAAHQELRSFIHDWNSKGFRRNPPTAAVVVRDAAENRDVQMVELRRPRLLEGGDVAFRAHTVKAVDHDSLQQFEERADGRVEDRFGEVNLFIDPARLVDLTLTFRNGPSVDSSTNFVATFTNASFAAPGNQGYVVTAQGAVLVAFYRDQLIIRGVDRHAVSGEIRFRMATQDPFIAGSVTLLPDEMSGEFAAGPDFLVPLKLGSFKLNYK